MASVHPDAEPARLLAPPPASFAEVVKLLGRTWPYIKPVVWHVVAWFSLAMGIGLVSGYIAISGSDLFNNAVLDAQPIAPAQAALLFVDSSYAEAEALTVEQRGVVLTRDLLYAVLFTIVFRMLLDSLGVVYWETWIGQAINQNLGGRRESSGCLGWHGRATAT